jgi:hypothetical protein
MPTQVVVFCFARKLVDLQQTPFAVRMADKPGLGAEPVAHYTRGRSELARHLPLFVLDPE